MTVSINGTTGISGVDGSASTPALQGSDTNTGISFGTDEVAINTGGTARATVDSAGRLLVGTSSARSNYLNNSTYSGLLQVEGTADASRVISFVHNTTDGAQPFIVLGKTRGSAAGSNTVVQNADGLGTISFQGSDGTELVEGARIQCNVDGTPGANDMPGRIVLSTTASGASSPTERMRIDNLGATSVVADTTTNAAIRFISNQAAGTTSSLLLGRYGGTLGNASTGTACFRVFTNGNVVNTNNSYGAISDIKLKENIVDASSQWDDIKALRPVNYNFKEDQTHTQIGLIAQEVELVSPGLVSESPDRDEDGNDLGTVTKSVNYSVLYMKAVKALQEAMERIETLEAEVQALKGGN